MLKGKKSEILLEIVKVLNKAGLGYEFEGDIINFGFADEENPNFSIAAWTEVLSKDMFSISFCMYNIRKLHREELADYVFSQKVGYTAIGVTEDMEKVIIVKHMSTECVDCLMSIISDTIKEVVPFIIGK